MPYRHRMHIFCLRVRREIFIRCILSSRTGHADQSSDVYISVAFTCMETICYDFEGSFGISHSLMSVKEPHLVCAIWGICTGEADCRGICTVWGKASLWWDPGYMNKHFCSSLDQHVLESQIFLPGFLKSLLSDLKGTEKRTQTLLYLKLSDYSFASRWLTDSTLSICQGILNSSPQLKYSHWQVLSSGLLTKTWEFIWGEIFLISQIQMYFPVKGALSAVSA